MIDQCHQKLSHNGKEETYVNIVSIQPFMNEKKEFNFRKLQLLYF